MRMHYMQQDHCNQATLSSHATSLAAQNWPSSPKVKHEGAACLKPSDEQHQGQVAPQGVQLHRVRMGVLLGTHDHEGTTQVQLKLMKLTTPLLALLQTNHLFLGKSPLHMLESASADNSLIKQHATCCTTRNYYRQELTVITKLCTVQCEGSPNSKRAKI